MKMKNLLIAVLIIFVFSIIYTCGKKQQQEIMQMPKQEGEQSNSIVQTIKPKAINYDSMLVIIGDLTQSIKENPTDINLRKKLVATSYDSTWETILAAGFGKPSEKDTMESASMALAEQAAKADAFRWAAYIKKWSVDPAIPDIASLSAEIKGGIVVAKKNLPHRDIMILLEVKKSNIR